MKKRWLILALAGMTGCYYPAYTVRRSTPVDPPVSKEEIERLASAGVSEGVMTELVEKRGAATLSTDDLVALNQPDSVRVASDQVASLARLGELAPRTACERVTERTQ